MHKAFWIMLVILMGIYFYMMFAYVDFKAITGRDYLPLIGGCAVIISFVSFYKYRGLMMSVDYGVIYYMLAVVICIALAGKSFTNVILDISLFACLLPLYSLKWFIFKTSFVSNSNSLTILLWSGIFLLVSIFHCL